MIGPERDQKRRARIEWLTRHVTLWNDGAPLTDERRKDIVNALKNEGLISVKTYWKDVNVAKEIEEAKSLILSRRVHAESETQDAGRDERTQVEDQQEGR